jgi:hypothetical protein
MVSSSGARKQEETSLYSLDYQKYAFIESVFDHFVLQDSPGPVVATPQAVILY